MRRVVLFLLITAISFLMISCDLVNPSTVDNIINNFKRDNPVDYEYWEERSSFPSEQNIGFPVTFVIDGKGYVCSGSIENGSGISMSQELWMYEPESDSWTQKSDFPGAGKYGGRFFILDDKVYIAGGKSFDSVSGDWVDSYDSWKYDPVSDVWTEIASIPEQSFNGLVFCEQGWSTIYDGKGLISTTDQQIYFVYDPDSDSWAKMSDFYYSPYALNMISDPEINIIPQQDGCNLYYLSISSTYNMAGYIDDFHNFSIDRIFPASINSYDYSYGANNISEGYYPVGLMNVEVETEYYQFLPSVTALEVDKTLYLFSNSYNCINLLSITDEGGWIDPTIGQHGWAEGLKSTESDKWRTYPLAFDDRIYFLDEGGHFFIYKI